MYRISHTKTEYTFFSSVNGTFLRVDHVLDQKTIFGKPKETEIISSIFSDYNAMTLEIKFKEEKKLAKKENVEAHTNVEAKQNATKQSIDHRINQRGNKIPRDKMKAQLSRNLWDGAKTTLS